MTEQVDWKGVEDALLESKREHYFNSSDDIAQSFTYILEAYNDNNPEWVTMLLYTYSKLRYIVTGKQIGRAHV